MLKQRHFERSVTRLEGIDASNGLLFAMPKVLVGLQTQTRCLECSSNSIGYTAQWKRIDDRGRSIEVIAFRRVFVPISSSPCPVLRCSFLCSLIQTYLFSHSILTQGILSVTVSDPFLEQGSTLTTKIAGRARMSFAALRKNSSVLQGYRQG